MTNEQFKPVRISDYYRDRIAKGLRDNIWETMFKPIFDILNSNNTVINAKSALNSALTNGRVYYENGAFKTVDRFSNAVASELETLGAKFKYGAYYIDRALLPVEIENALAMIAARESAKLVALSGLLVRLASDVTKAQFNKLLIDEAAQLMFKKLEKDLIDSTSEGKVPTIGTYYEVPDFEIADTKINQIEDYWEQTEKEAKPLHDDWKAKDDLVNDLKTQLLSATGSTKEEIQKQLNRAEVEREEARQKLADFRDAQQKNAPTINLDEDIPTTETQLKLNYKGNGSDGGNDSDDNNGNDGSGSDTDSNTNTNIDYTSSLDVFKEDKWTKKIVKDYVYNMNFWVKKWKAKEIIKMRRDVLEMVQSGARTETIQKYFEKEWKIAKDKAAFLARNESEIASSVLKAVHYQRQGCTHFFWLKSTSKEKRELHLEYAKETGNKYGVGGTNIFSFADPPIIEQLKIGTGKDAKYIPQPGGQRGLPGQTYNCLPGDARIISPFNNLRFYRRVYEGKLTSIITSSKAVLKCTPNHPILTDKGWVGAGSLKIGDKIVKVKDDFILSCTKYPQNTIPTISELFNFFSIAFNSKRVTHSTGDFHGDISVDQQVDVIDIKNGLFFNTETVVDEQIIKFIFAETEKVLGRFNIPCDSSFFKSLPFSRFISNRYISILDQLLAFFESQFGIMDSTCFNWCSQIYVQACKSFGYCLPSYSELFGEFQQTGTGQIQLGYRFCWELYTLLCDRWLNFKSIETNSSSEIMSFTALELGNLGQTEPLGIEFDTVLDKSESIFCSHIYNLENVNNWYLYHNFIIKNCSCNLVGIKNPQYYINRQKIENAKRNIFTKIKYTIENSLQRNNYTWRYRRFGEG